MVLKYSYLLISLGAASCAIMADTGIHECMASITRKRALAEPIASPAADAVMPELVGSGYAFGSDYMPIDHSDALDISDGLADVWVSTLPPVWTSSPMQPDFNPTAIGTASLNTTAGSASVASTSFSDSIITSITAVNELVATFSSNSSQVPSELATSVPISSPIFSSSTSTSATSASSTPPPSSTSFESYSSANTTTLTTVITLSASNNVTHKQEPISTSRSNAMPVDAAPPFGCVYEYNRKIGNGEYISYNGVSCGTSTPSSVTIAASASAIPSITIASTSSSAISSVNSDTATATSTTTGVLGPVEAALQWLSSATSSSQTGNKATAVVTVDEPIASSAGANRLRLLYW